ncbi:MAG: hypothetical protein AAGE94_12040 [Acidobacteriota bacterium]
MTEIANAPPSTDVRRLVGVLVRGALITGTPFVLTIVYLVAHRAGWVERHRAIAYERTLILVLVLYWAVAAVLAAALVHRRPLIAWVRRQGPQIALAIVSASVSLLFVEVALRIVRPESAVRAFERWPSPTLHHVNAPNRSSLGMGEKLVTTNRDGFRTDYEREDFLAHEHRIALLGDSYVFGLGVAAEDAVAVVLEGALGEDGSDVAVLNTGVISYSPMLERQAFRQIVREYQPTLTLLFVDMNDIGDDHQYGVENVSGDPSSPRFDVPEVDDRLSLCERSALCRTLGPVWERLGKPIAVAGKLLGRHRERYDYYAFEVDVAGTIETNRFFIVRHPLADTRGYFDATWAHIEATADDVRAAGSDFVLVVMPRYFHWDDTEAPENWEHDVYGVDEPYESAYLDYFDQQGSNASFPVWSLLPAFSATPGPHVFRHDPHWNASGHRVVADALAQWLRAAGWPETLDAAGPIPSRPTMEPAADAAADEAEGAGDDVADSPATASDESNGSERKL